MPKSLTTWLRPREKTKPALARQWGGAAEGAALLGPGENQEHNTENFKGGRKTTRNWLEGARKVTMGPAKRKQPQVPGADHPERPAGRGLRTSGPAVLSSLILEAQGG